MLSSLVYLSSRPVEVTDEVIEDILKVAQINNKKLGITGVLLYSDTQFLQCIEGDYANLIALYDKIKLDDRHKQLFLLNLSPIAERNFPSWQMGAKAFDANRIKFIDHLTTEEQTEFTQILNGETVTSGRSINLLRKYCN